MQYLIEKPEKGSLLVAEPFLDDPNFRRSIILLTEHNKDGSVGFVINKPLELKLDEIIVDFPSFDTLVYHGGPVQEDNLYFIHNKGDLLPGSERINDKLYWGGDLESLKGLIRCNNLITSDDIRFFLGYSGWSIGQLLNEISENSWMVLKNATVNILKDEPREMWKKTLMKMGGKYSLWANSPSDPSLN